MTIQASFNDDQTVAVDSFSGAGDREILHWLKQRLQGYDPYFPVDSRFEEDPDALVASLLESAGPVHPVSQAISRCLLALLDEARSLAPSIPAYFDGVLRVCRHLLIPNVASFFYEELEAIAGDPRDAARRWGSEEQVKNILLAAIRQAPGYENSASRDAWMGLLRLPKFCTVALRGLAPEFIQRIRFLRVWWEICPREERRRDLKQMIGTALKTYGTGLASVFGMQLTEAELAALPELRSAIDEVAVEIWGIEVFGKDEAVAVVLKQRSSYVQSMVGVARTEPALDII